MKCPAGETEGAEVAVLTVRPDTTQWTREVKLQAGYEIKGSIAVCLRQLYLEWRGSVRTE